MQNDTMDTTYVGWSSASSYLAETARILGQAPWEYEAARLSAIEPHYHSPNMYTKLFCTGALWQKLLYRAFQAVVLNGYAPFRLLTFHIPAGIAIRVAVTCTYRMWCR